MSVLLSHAGAAGASFHERGLRGPLNRRYTASNQEPRLRKSRGREGGREGSRVREFEGMSSTREANRRIPRKTDTVAKEPARDESLPRSGFLTRSRPFEDDSRHRVGIEARNARGKRNRAGKKPKLNPRSSRSRAYSNRGPSILNCCNFRVTDTWTQVTFDVFFGS